MSRALIATLLSLSLGACESASATIGAPATPDPAAAVGVEPLAGGLPSSDALGQAVVAALNARDAAALTRLAVDEAEYTGRLFPAIAVHPAAESMGRHLLWDMHDHQSRDDLQRAIDRHGGQDLRFVRFEPRQLVRRAGVVFHQRPRVVVLDPDGAEHSLQLLASLVEHESTQTFKLLGFRDHD